MRIPLLVSIGAVFVATTWAHAVVTLPVPRKVGAEVKSACGTPVYNGLASDETGPIEDYIKKADSAYNDTACSIHFCKGYKLSDNASNTRVYAPGAVVPFNIKLVAHHTGWANVSIVDLKTQKVIGTPLKKWDVYANETLGPWDWPVDETNFTVTVPNLAGKCKTSGSCAIQWWWYSGYSNKQTYESCVDFTQA